jgi:enolase-phosphatase E1
MIRAILTDIEGTTSSLSFVKDVLFPYARAYLPDFVRAHAHEPEVRASLDESRALMGELHAGDERVIAQLLQWIDEDRKITPLKALQGSVWKRGYAAGDFKGHIYEDATAALKAWHARGIALYVYSSGSVPAQKLLFAHTPAGDLTPLFSGYYDTRIGAKVEADSYRRIAADIGFRPDEVLFLSDIQRELDAAREAGMQTWQLVREGEFDANVEHRQARSFVEITL